MFCSNCGNQMDARARFCSACGTTLAGASAVPPAAPQRIAGQIVRPRGSRMIAGVCAGFAEHYGWDMGLVRVATVVIVLLTSGAAILAYLAAWIVIPEGQYALPVPPPPPPMAPPFESQTT